MTATINSVRRYYLLKRFASQQACDGLEQVWRGKQEAAPGVPLSDSFPYRSRLVEQGYSTVEDLNGADVCELQTHCFSPVEAAEILTALASEV